MFEILLKFSQGAVVALDGRGVSVQGYEKGNFVGPTVITNVKPVFHGFALCSSFLSHRVATMATAL